MISFDPTDGSAAQRAARAELRKPEYHRDDPGLVDRVLHWIGRRFNSLFDGTAGSSATLILLLLLLAAVIFAVVKAGSPQRVPRLGRPGDHDPLRPLGARDHRRLAVEFAAAGRRAEAMREWLRAAVQTIEDRGVLMPEPGRTGAATARQAGPLLPSSAADLRAATRAFDEVWFGGRAAVDADVAIAQTAADGVLSARIERAVPGPNDYALPW
ncbi:MAG: DUF4129 domain-containing protein [Actinomycetota bacterium]|nr:DUF4129 domain-containing protein [Actinomycetota bacterium]